MISKMTRGGFVAVAVVALAVPVTLVGTAGSASAPCGTGGSGNRDTSANVRMTAGVAANIRRGSSTSCAVRGWADNRDVLDYWWYTRNADNSTWTYLRNVTDNAYGWVSDSLLPNGGSNFQCL
ncbi:SH3 domain-containing protein [Streptomyces tailanensis]|uniref:SH3 domain-containing protein n=1 Tax=Streptomyces tailanensis TaxID=2569858 RepID=UPI001FE7EDB6|nr:SH3 domain-containing protein [Streptomyces tailanensis]